MVRGSRPAAVSVSLATRTLEFRSAELVRAIHNLFLSYASDDITRFVRQAMLDVSELTQMISIGTPIDNRQLQDASRRVLAAQDFIRLLPSPPPRIVALREKIDAVLALCAACWLEPSRLLTPRADTSGTDSARISIRRRSRKRCSCPARSGPVQMSSGG